MKKALGALLLAGGLWLVPGAVLAQSVSLPHGASLVVGTFRPQQGSFQVEDDRLVFRDGRLVVRYRGFSRDLAGGQNPEQMLTEIFSSLLGEAEGRNPDVAPVQTLSQAYGIRVHLAQTTAGFSQGRPGAMAVVFETRNRYTALVQESAPGMASWVANAAFLELLQSAAFRPPSPGPRIRRQTARPPPGRRGTIRRGEPTPTPAPTAPVYDENGEFQVWFAPGLALRVPRIDESSWEATAGGFARFSGPSSFEIRGHRFDRRQTSPEEAAVEVLGQRWGTRVRRVELESAGDLAAALGIGGAFTGAVEFDGFRHALLILQTRSSLLVIEQGPASERQWRVHGPQLDGLWSQGRLVTD